MIPENERGIIAETYDHLHGIHKLEIAIAAYPVAEASPESILRSILQATEITLLNLTDLTLRATKSLRNHQVGRAIVHLSWAYSFHTVLDQLSLIPKQLSFLPASDPQVQAFHIQDSASFHQYFEALKAFDQEVLEQCQSGSLDPQFAIADLSIDSIDFELFHLARLCNHQAEIWEERFTNILIPTIPTSYSEFVSTPAIATAVYDIALTGDTFFMQFRGLHQIPEILARTMNDLLEATIKAIQADQLQQAIEHLRSSNLITDTIVSCLPAIARNLSTNDYHEIRENLGLTSGSHSVSLRYHLFSDLYTQLWDALQTYAIHHFADEADETEPCAIPTLIQHISQQRFSDLRSWFVHLLFNECLRLRTFIDQWRALHLHLPRNNLGSNFTKSLTGSPDAVQVTAQMHAIARTKDAMKYLTHLPAPQAHPVTEQQPWLSEYFKSNASLDRYLLYWTGQITQHRFKAVQEQSGIFSRRCPFAPPPHRTVE